MSTIKELMSQLDEQIQKLINERAKLAFRVRESKGESKERTNETT